jgi:hypothetical protein
MNDDDRGEDYPGSSDILELLEDAVADNDITYLKRILKQRKAQMILAGVEEFDDDIVFALRHAIEHIEDSLEICRLLYEYLSRRTKQLRSAGTTNEDDFAPLQLAATNGKVLFLQWLVEEQGWNVNQNQVLAW